MSITNNSIAICTSKSRFETITSILNSHHEIQDLFVINHINITDLQFSENSLLRNSFCVILDFPFFDTIHLHRLLKNFPAKTTIFLLYKKESNNDIQNEIITLLNSKKITSAFDFKEVEQLIPFILNARSASKDQPLQSLSLAEENEQLKLEIEKLGRMIIRYSDEVNTILNDLEQHNIALDNIIAISNAILRNEKPAIIFEMIGNFAKLITETEKIAILQRSHSGNDFMVVFMSPEKSQKYAYEILSTDNPITKSIQEGRVLTFNDHASIQAITKSTTYFDDVQNMLCVPMIGEENKIIGAIAVMNKLLHDGFKPAHNFILRAMSVLLVNAIKNYELISAIQQKNFELTEQKQQLMDLDKEKNDILGIVAHDLKNPIMNIKMLADILIHPDKVTQEDISEFSNDILTTSNRMFEMVTNLLDMNRLQSGHIKVSPTDFDICQTLDAIYESYSNRASEKNIKVNISGLDEHLFVFADKDLIFQAIDNIVSNALKYSPYDKNIWISVEISKPTLKTIRVAVRDEGPGLSEDDLKKLFGKFARLSARPTGGEHSTGLGLSIVKKLVEAMNGKVWCESELGKGATFFVEVPRSLPK